MRGEALITVARLLRGNQTDAEQSLWSRLRLQQCCGFRFRCQVPLGIFVIEFAFLSESFIVEVDAGQHTNQKDTGAGRRRWFVTEGYRVLQLWNHDVQQNTNGVAAAIERTLQGQ